MMIPSPSRTRRVVVGFAANHTERLTSGGTHGRR